MARVKRPRNQKAPIPKTVGGKKTGPPVNDHLRKVPFVTPADMDLAKEIPDPENTTMYLNEYQHRCKEFIAFPDKFTITYPALGLASEAGEVCGKIKKVIRDHKDLGFAGLPEDVKHELGDVLWYLAVLAYNLGLSLEEVALANLEKLRDRKERDAIKGSGDNR